MALDPVQIDDLQPRAKAYKVADGFGLYLHVLPDGRKYWRFGYRWAGKQNVISCGIYPATDLTEARLRCNAALALLRDGTDPSAHSKAERIRKRDELARQANSTRFLIDSRGALSFRLGSRHVSLTPSETAELRTFLEATRTVASED